MESSKYELSLTEAFGFQLALLRLSRDEPRSDANSPSEVSVTSVENLLRDAANQWQTNQVATNPTTPEEVYQVARSDRDDWIGCLADHFLRLPETERQHVLLSSDLIAPTLARISERDRSVLAMLMLLTHVSVVAPHQSKGKRDAAIRDVGRWLGSPVSLEYADEMKSFYEESIKDVTKSQRLKKRVVYGTAGVAAMAIIGPFAAAPAIGGAIGSVGSLSGAAATNAGLAALGGGSLATGGLGMAGGTALVTSVLSAGGAGASALVRPVKDVSPEELVADCATKMCLARYFCIRERSRPPTIGSLAANVDANIEEARSNMKEVQNELDALPEGHDERKKELKSRKKDLNRKSSVLDSTKDALKDMAARESWSLDS